MNNLVPGNKIKLTEEARTHYQSLSNWYEITAYYDRCGEPDRDKHTHPYFEQEYESRDVRLYELKEDGGKPALFLVYDWDVESVMIGNSNKQQNYDHTTNP